MVTVTWSQVMGRKSVAVVSLAFLLFYAGGAILLANVAHQGGRLVHEYGWKVTRSEEGVVRWFDRAGVECRAGPGP